MQDSSRRDAAAALSHALGRTVRFELTVTDLILLRCRFKTDIDVWNWARGIDKIIAALAVDRCERTDQCKRVDA